MVCPECGKTLDQGKRFCRDCGWDSKLAGAGKAASTVGQRPAWKRWTMSVTYAFFAGLVLWVLLMPRETNFVSLQLGQAAPDFELSTLDGRRVRLSDLRGKPVVLNFWATWCAPCRREMPDFQAVLDKHRDNGIQMYGINVGEGTVAVRDFMEQVGARFPVLIDHNEEIQAAYKILPLPTTFFIDRNGVIRQIYQTQMSAAQIESEVLRLLAVQRREPTAGSFAPVPRGR